MLTAGREKPVPQDFYYLKGICPAICQMAGVTGESFPVHHPKLSNGMEIRKGDLLF